MFRSDTLNSIGSANRSGSIYLAGTTITYFNEKKWFSEVMKNDIIPAMEAVAQKDFPIVLLFDGDIPQVQATFDSEVLALLKKKDVDVVKLPAACSHNTQPNDVSRIHPKLRKATDSVMKEIKTSSRSSQIEVLPQYFSAFETWLQDNCKLGSEVKQLIQHFFKHAPKVLSNALTPAAVMDGYSTTGVFPFNHVKLLQQCTAFPQMSGDTAALIKRALLPMTSQFINEGWCTEQVMDELKIPNREELCEDFKQTLEIEQELQNKRKRRSH